MNLVGKIFVVLIFVMSLVWMSLALAVYASHKNWRDVVMNPREQVTAEKPLGLLHVVSELKAKNQELKEQLDKITSELNAEKAAKRQALAKLETERDELLRKLDEQDKALAALTQSERESVAAMKAAHETLSAMRTEITGLRQEIRDAQKAQKDNFDLMVARTDELHQAANEMRSLKSINQRLVDDLTKYRDTLNVLGYKGAIPPSEIPPVLDGVVLETPGEGLIEISLGSDEGLIKGHRLEVFRSAEGASTYLGRVEVLRTTADRAVCQIIPEFLRGTIVKGDRVATKLN